MLINFNAFLLCEKINRGGEMIMKATSIIKTNEVGTKVMTTLSKETEAVYARQMI